MVSHDPSGGLSEIFFAVVFLPRLFGSFFVHFARRFYCASPGLVIFGRFCHVHLPHASSRVPHSLSESPAYASAHPASENSLMAEGLVQTLFKAGKRRPFGALIVRRPAAPCGRLESLITPRQVSPNPDSPRTRCYSGIACRSFKLRRSSL